MIGAGVTIPIILKFQTAADAYTKTIPRNARSACSSGLIMKKKKNEQTVIGVIGDIVSVILVIGYAIQF